MKQLSAVFQTFLTIKPLRIQQVKNRNKHMSTAQKNGTAPATQNGAKTVSLVPDTKKADTPTPQIESVPNPVEKQRQRLQTLDALFNREEKLTDSKKLLQDFKIGSEENSQSLQLRDTKGATFSTSNPEVIKEVISLMEKFTTAKLAEVQSQIIAA
jgi:hypothetical protein